MGSERSARQWQLPRALPSLPVELAVAGYRTAAFVDDAQFEGSVGLERGFQEVRRIDDDWERRERGPARSGRRLGARPGPPRTTGSAWSRWTTCCARSRSRTPSGTASSRGATSCSGCPRSVPTRRTSTPSRPSWEGGTVPMARYDARYDGAIRRLDAALQRLFDRLEGGGRYKRTTVCLIGTHGLQFGEAGMLLDHGLLSPMDVHVPLLLRPATRLGSTYEEGHESSALVASMDVAPTLLALANVEPATPMHGISLVERFAGPEDPADRERVVVVSCGTITGSAAYGDELVVEHLVPAFDTNLARPVARSGHGTRGVARGAHVPVARTRAAARPRRRTGGTRCSGPNFPPSGELVHDLRRSRARSDVGRGVGADPRDLAALSALRGGWLRALLCGSGGRVARRAVTTCTSCVRAVRSSPTRPSTRCSSRISTPVTRGSSRRSREPREGPAARVRSAQPAAARGA
ncbi:Sulfatase [Planctomycetes bacterium Pla163]|uniref:Sulfatase n=1 Tax=Rohdeia mirabilis TaxID=2528008 RepID=A0A518CYP4_9BACT|nr:Sulfatase [Planctomycetes bacterium Pla163]